MQADQIQGTFTFLMFNLFMIIAIFIVTLTNKSEGQIPCTTLTNWLMFYNVVLVADSVHKIMLTPGSLMMRCLYRFKILRLAWIILGFIIDSSHLIWFLWGALNISSDSKQCIANNTILTVTLLLVFIFVMINIAKMVFIMLALLFQCLGNIYQVDTNWDRNNGNREPLIP